MCKMKFSILGFNQQKCLQLTAIKEVKGKDGPKNVELRLDVTDLLILRSIADLMNRAKIRKVIIEDKMYCWVKYATIIEDLPILGIKQQALTDRLDKMATLNLLEKQVEHTQLGTFSYFRVGKKYEDLLYDKDDATSSEAQDRTCSEIPEGTSSQLQVPNSNIYNNTSTNNYSTIKESKEDKSSFKKDVDAFVDRMYSLYPTKCPMRNKTLGKSHKHKEKIKSLLKTYSMEEVEKVFRHEVETKLGIAWLKDFGTFLNNFPDPSQIEFTPTDNDTETDKTFFNGVEYR